MSNNYIYLKIKAYSSIAKCIEILRKYDNHPMIYFKNKIVNNDYVISCEYTDDINLKKLIKCYEDLTTANINVEVYELNDEITSIELLYNLIETYDSISKEIEAEDEKNF